MPLTTFLAPRRPAVLLPAAAPPLDVDPAFEPPLEPPLPPPPRDDRRPVLAASVLFCSHGRGRSLRRSWPALRGRLRRVEVVVEEKAAESTKEEDIIVLERDNAPPLVA